jgi:hypothetical protein
MKSSHPGISAASSQTPICIVLAVNPIVPRILSQPADQSVVAGSLASLAVVAEGTPPLHCQWSFNGAVLDGATADFLTIASARFDYAGIYGVTVTNEFGHAVRMRH